jgi:UDP-2,4-diacetamido-2,4,6-trideoxy-beta-L-altropyranose hydrolase
MRVGTGHIMRCIALGQWGKSQGDRIIFLSHCQSDKLRQRIIDEGFEFIPIKKSHPDPGDLEKTISALSANGLQNWIIVDGYHFSAEYQKAIRDTGHKLLFIDDMVNHSNYHANILLNQNIHAPELEYHFDPESIQLLGSRYVLLRQEFLPYRDVQKKVPAKATNILVTLGGADIDNTTLKVIKALNLLNESRIAAKIIVGKIIVGPANPNISSLKNELNHSVFKYELLSSVREMPQCIAWADMAISAGGTTCWELCYLGVPFLIVILSENQTPIAEGLEKKGIAINMGWHKNMIASDLANRIFDLKENISKRRAMIGAGKKLIDGQGNKRIYDLINFLNDDKEIKKYIRRAQEKDCLQLFTLSNDPFVRKNSFSSNEIKFDDHKKWFDSKLKSKDSCIFVAEISNILMGQIRYDKKEDMALISIAISRAFRGLGLGCRMIESTFIPAGKELSVNKIRAMVKDSNPASVHTFINAGFQKVDETIVCGYRSQIFEKMI